jgi:putative oxidoreductase
MSTNIQERVASVEHAVARSSLTRQASQRGVDLLRISLGLVFLVFGVLKFFPGVSPAEPLVVRTLDTLSLGLVDGRAAMVLTAIMETLIGLSLVTGRYVKGGLVLLAMALVGILSPLVLFFDDLVLAGPTLEAQYVFKDIVLVAAGLVVAVKELGGRLEPPRR